MASDLRSFVARRCSRFKRRFYGPTFRCPVCHLELATVDADGNAILVCPLCGAVLDVDSVYGHVVPVVVDMELMRPQPKARLHPLATHLPIGLYPFALLGAVALALLSLASHLGLPGTALAARAPVLASAVLVLLLVSVGFSLATFASGLWDWSFRYRRRPYRVIRLKIAFSVLFLACGGAAIAMQASGLVFAGSTGLVTFDPLGLLAALAYFGALGAGMVVLATLGHVGGTLVYGR